MSSSRTDTFNTTVFSSVWSFFPPFLGCKSRDLGGLALRRGAPSVVEGHLLQRYADRQRVPLPRQSAGLRIKLQATLPAGTA